MKIKEWAENKIRTRKVGPYEAELVTPFPLADMAMETWPYVCVHVSKVYEFSTPGSIIKGCKVLTRQIREEMDITLDDFIVVANQPYDGKFVMAFESYVNAVQCRMICESGPEFEVTAGY